MPSVCCSHLRFDFAHHCTNPPIFMFAFNRRMGFRDITGLAKAALAYDTAEPISPLACSQITHYPHNNQTTGVAPLDTQILTKGRTEVGGRLAEEAVQSNSNIPKHQHPVIQHAAIECRQKLPRLVLVHEARLSRRQTPADACQQKNWRPT